MRAARCLGSLVWLWCLALAWSARAQPMVHHELQVTLQPAQHVLLATDTITLPTWPSEMPPLVLHAGMQPVSLTPGVQLSRLPGPAASAAPPPLAYYRLTLPPGVQTFTLQYQGVIQHPLTPEEVEYRLGLRETPGLITTDGAYLSAATAWYPQFGSALLTFRLDVRLPPGWEAISQGGRTQHDRTPEGTSVRWESSVAQERMYLIAGPLSEYTAAADGVQALVFLRTPEAALAQTYLDATAQYLRLYQQLLGPYLYPKFALVENFWESGFGMPSFTLLGSKVIRLPFIIHSSYPHEILHNWWGNGVFIDLQAGNWAEGLTAYLADHLVQEQRGTGTAYRRGVLQKYTHVVATEHDLPLTAFRARHSAATAAIGYGKALMLFHMLRQQLGDAVFIKALQVLYRDYALQRASFGTLQHVFTAVAGVELAPLFQQWVTQSGAPELRLGSATVQPEGTASVVRMRLEQTQDGSAYRLRVPVAFSLHGVTQAFQTVVEMTQKQADYSLRLPAPPRRLDVDPEFDLFRRLHAAESPPAFAELFGAARLLLVLPRSAAPAVAQSYQQLAQVWAQTLTPAIDIRWDADLDTLPADAAVWLFGWENRWLPVVQQGLAAYGVTVSATGVQLAGQGLFREQHIAEQVLSREQHSVVLVVRKTVQPQHALAWMAAHTPAAMPGLGRKLPHYGTYSFLSFTGEEPVKVLQGQWPVLASPLSVLFPSSTEGHEPLAPAAPLRPRPALAPPP